MKPPLISRLPVALLAAAALLCVRAMPAHATPVLWGPSGVLATDGYLDASLIPFSTGTTPVVYTNVNGEGYDIAVTTSNLSASGPTTFLGDGGWYFQGTAPTSKVYSIITFRFYQTGTNIPVAVTGAHLVFQDAESQELFGGFSYFNASGAQVPVLFDDSIFSYSYGADFLLNYVEASNNALQQGGPQDGKSVEANFSLTPISGFTFGAYRQSSAAGSIVMMGLGDLTVSP